MTIPRAEQALLTWSPQGVRDLFMAPPERLGAYGADLAAPAVGEHSLLVLEGERHKRERKRLAPAFHGARMAAYGSIVVQATRRHAGRAPRGVPVDARQIAEAISLEVILRAVFGVDDDAQLAPIGTAVTGALGAVTPLVVFVKAARRDLGRLSPGGRLLRAQARCDAVLQAHIDARRAQPGARDDILSLVLGLVDDEGRALSDRELLDELKTMLFAGHETTATAIAWTLFEVLRAPDVRARLQAEVRAVPPDDAPEAPAKIGSLPYLAAVCQEALRRWPVVVDVMRSVRQPITVAGVPLPAGASVCVPLALLHRDEALFPDPDAFRPARFLERRFAPHEYAPFGGGVRRCLGADLALYEMKLVIATMLRDDWSLVDPTPPGTVLRNITVGPRKAIEIVRGS